ncbi:WSC domain-containing protein [Tricladium varicosporioides]|nr:WSC domain-containing protein [Hymenoscyphus varicosporioides]
MAATSYASPLKTLAARQPDVGGFAYTGCYTEATSQRALSGNSFFDDAMTLEKCAAACSGFPHFGVEYGRECYCGSTLNTGSVSTSEDECNFACSGNAAEKCGAGNRLNVYSKTVTTPTTCTASYGLMGCYSEGTNQRALVGKMIGNDSMTIDMCAASCSGYKYFGLEYYRECYCGDEFSDGSVELAATDCTFPCMGDQTEVCGGGSKLSIYSFDSISNPSSASSTSTSAPTSTPSSASLYVANGCRTEGTNGRALASASYFDDAMTVEKCEAICEGYTYFGLEYGRECYCGNLFGTGSVATLASECSMTCPGNRAQMCGAGDRLSLYVLKSSLPVSSSTSLSSLISSSSTLSSISSTSTSVSSSTSASSSALSSSSLSSVSTSSTTTTTSSSTSQAISSSSTQVTPSSTSSSSIQTTSTSFSSVSSTTSSSVSSTFTSITSSLSSVRQHCPPIFHAA